MLKDKDVLEIRKYLNKNYSLKLSKQLDTFNPHVDQALYDYLWQAFKFELNISQYAKYSDASFQSSLQSLAKKLNMHTTSTVKGKFQSKPFKYFGNMDLSDGKHKNHSLIFIENNKYYIKQNGKWKASKNNNVDAKDYKQPMKFLNEKMFKKNIKYSQSGQNVNVSLDLNAKQRQQFLNMLMQDKSTDALDKAMIQNS